MCVSIKKRTVVSTKYSLHHVTVLSSDPPASSSNPFCLFLLTPHDSSACFSNHVIVLMKTLSFVLCIYYECHYANTTSLPRQNTLLSIRKWIILNHNTIEMAINRALLQRLSTQVLFRISEGVASLLRMRAQEREKVKQTRIRHSLSNKKETNRNRGKLGLRPSLSN